MRRILNREAVSVASAWFVAFAGPTLALKLAYLRALSGGDLSLFQGGAATTSVTSLLLQYFWPADVLSAAALTALVLLVRATHGARAGHRTGVVALCVCLVIGLIVASSLRQTGALPSPDTLRIAIHWLVQNPQLIPVLNSVPDIALLAAALLWMLAPRVLARIFDSALKVPYAGAWPSFALLLWIVVSLPAPATAGSRASDSASRQSIWLSVAHSLFPASDSIDPEPGLDRNAEYLALAYPYGRPSQPALTVRWPPAQRRPRHVILVSLETAARKFYNLERADLPAFRALTARALVAERHYSPAPMTSMSLFSILTGTYPPPPTAHALTLLRRRPAVAAHSLPVTLKSLGFESTFIDTYDLSWNGPAESDVLQTLGFDAVLDARSLPASEGRDPFERRLAAERHSFERVEAAVLKARQRNARAFVTLATHLGHYDWPRPSGQRPDLGDPLGHVLTALDGLMGKLIRSLDAQGIRDDVIVIVTGDHGPRFRSESDALGESFSAIDTMFHVPFLISAPALFLETVHVPYTTSHVDLAPTILALLGQTGDDASYHGESMLDGRLADRATFVSSGRYPGLRPLDGLRYGSALYLKYDAVDRVTITRDADGLEQPVRQSAGTLTEDDVRKRLEGLRSITR